jgi:hypothetical protein
MNHLEEGVAQAHEGIAAETTAREEAIRAEVQERQQGESALEFAIAGEAAAREDAIRTEAQERMDADQGLGDRIAALAPEGLDDLPGLLAKKADIDSPTFTGDPKVPNKTSAPTDDGTLIATEAQVKTVADSNVLKAPLNNPTFTGTPKVPNKTAAAGSDGTLIATEYQVSLKANIAGPNFTGSPAVSSNKIAVVPATSSDGETNLPVGTYLLIGHGGGSPLRNGTADLNIANSTGQYAVRGESGANASSPLSGTWRLSGRIGSNYLFRRTA